MHYTAKMPLVLVWPLPALPDHRTPVISQEYHPGHDGVDLMYRRPKPVARPIDNGSKNFDCPRGTMVYAAAEGRVRLAAVSHRGWNVVIDHDHGMATYYQHLDTLDVVRGQPILAQTPIGTVGIDPTDPEQVRHLHFEVWRYDGANRTCLDPAPYLSISHR